MDEFITLAHGFGGRQTQELLDEVIVPALAGGGHAPTLDAAVLPDLVPPLVMSTDSFTVLPHFFPGGDIGKLAICGTVNDVAMMGGRPRYFALGLILEEGLPLSVLRRIMVSLGDTARAAGVTVVTGDTKVVEKGGAVGLYLNTTGLGPREFVVGPERVRAGDAILISGTVADHGAAILNAREDLGFSAELRSDCAPLWDLASAAARAAGDMLHALRDPTRGGLAATLNEFATDTGLNFVIEEARLPFHPATAAFLAALGLDPLPIANEGKCLLLVAPEAVDRVLAAVHADQYGRDAALIGRVEAGGRHGRVILETVIGTRRVVPLPLEAGLPRIC
jgi:hydrogenase expression/formation protein HypE